MTTNIWKKTVIKFTFLSLLFSWPIMFLVDSFLVFKFANEQNMKVALVVLLLGHALAMLGPAVAGFITQKTVVKTSFPEWKWGKLKYYLFSTLFFIVIWSIPAIIGVVLKKFHLQPNVDNSYHLYMMLYIFVVPIAGLGEELGWCSFLLSYLTPFIGKTRSVIISGLIRGIWHLPVLLGPFIYKFATGAIGLNSLLIRAVVLLFQLAISNIFFGAFFSLLWYKTKCSPLLGWSHFVADLVRDFITILVINYSGNSLAMLVAQLPIILIGASYLEKLKKEEGIKGFKAYFIK